MLKLKVEIESVTPLMAAFEESVILASSLNLIVEFVHYGIVCQAYPNTDFEVGVTQFEEIRKDPGQGKIAYTKSWGS